MKCIAGCQLCGIVIEADEAWMLMDAIATHSRVSLHGKYTLVIPPEVISGFQREEGRINQ